MGLPAATTEPFEPVPFFQHDLGRRELDSLGEVLAGTILTTGSFVDRFEQGFAGYLGRGHCVGLTSCTAALHLALVGLGIGPGDEVITTPMTFVATATAILQAGASPVFVDVEEATGNLDAAAIEAAITPRTRAILPVHLYGQMCDMRAIREIADRRGLKVIEDSAHCVEGRRDGIGPGELGDAACFSFYATKSITSGEGGALVTDDPALAASVRLLRHHGMDRTAAHRHEGEFRHWEMVRFGWKYNMDNLQAALLLPQLDRIEANFARRARLYHRYTDRLASLAQVGAPVTLPGVRHAGHLFTIWVEAELRDDLIAFLQRRQIGAAVNYRAIHLLEYFRRSGGYASGLYPVAEAIGAATVSLPLYAGMPAHHVDLVVAAVDDFFVAKP